VSRAVTTDDIARRVADAVAAIRTRTALTPRVALTLGSGLGGVVDAVERATVFATHELPHWPRSTVPGHAGRLAIGTWRGVPVAALSGRSHRYEGYPLDRVTFAVRVFSALGARVQIFTNAVGGIHPDLAPAEVMLATGHLNFIGKRGLLSPDELRAWVALRLAPWKHLRDAIVVDEVPRNPAGKILRRRLIERMRGIREAGQQREKNTCRHCPRKRAIQDCVHECCGILDRPLARTMATERIVDHHALPGSGTGGRPA